MEKSNQKEIQTLSQDTVEKKHLLIYVNIILGRLLDFTKTRKLNMVKNIQTYFFRAMCATGKIRRIDYVLNVSQPPMLGNKAYLNFDGDGVITVRKKVKKTI